MWINETEAFELRAHLHNKHVLALTSKTSPTAARLISHRKIFRDPRNPLFRTLLMMNLCKTKHHNPYHERIVMTTIFYLSIGPSIKDVTHFSCFDNSQSTTSHFLTLCTA